ncbi:MAG: S-methyl-5-thioribose-1-phosphate isomerase [Gammaproteobacteria bacterium]|nr:S-methyl-5-thioribose-1-phosphate isomerase [Gammaproteobacteria bacterium]MCF6231238.1 S-methyl-5-thioribose-1-phosphate isomerase [Gammaproteobacteria bacterium]
MTNGTLHDTIRAIRWADGKLHLLDQRTLPGVQATLSYGGVAEVADAIRDMVVRGAPAIGVTAAYGVVLSARAQFLAAGSAWQSAMQGDLERLAQSRPTAVNLFWAIERMQSLISTLNGENPEPALLKEAMAIHEEDIAANRRMGELGSALIESPCAVLTHCNTGSLATAGYGTALGVIRSAYAAGKISEVFADETRPWLQGARLTAWECVQDNIPVTLLADGAAAHLMKQGDIKWVIVGSDRIAANGDVANKIGTYHAAIAAKYHGIKFMVVAPTTTIDMEISCGDEIPIEMRPASEVLGLNGQTVAAEGAKAWNPSFDITPASLVDAIVTERGVVLNPDREKMAILMSGCMMGSD